MVLELGFGSWTDVSSVLYQRLQKVNLVRTQVSSQFLFLAIKYHPVIASRCHASMMGILRIASKLRNTDVQPLTMLEEKNRFQPVLPTSQSPTTSFTTQSVVYRRAYSHFLIPIFQFLSQNHYSQPPKQPT